MYLKPEGQPLHTRSLSVDLRAAGDLVHARGDVIDLRKRGVMPVPGGMQAAGIIHQMHLDAHIDRRRRTLEKLLAEQPRVAFEASDERGGECCRDPVQRLQTLVGRRFDSAFPRELSRSFGGPRGCSHLLTLFQLMASVVPEALDRETEMGFGPSRSQGERFFTRMLVLDGFEPAEGTMQMSVQLTDVHTRPATQAGAPLERLHVQCETQLLARVEMGGMTLTGLEASQRQRGADDFGDAAWNDLGAVVAPLVSRPLMAGMAGELLRRFGGDPAVRPLLDTLLQLAPGFIQCMAAVLDRWLERAASASKSGSDMGASVRRAAVGGQTDSCYMWRSDGAMARLRGGSG